MVLGPERSQTKQETERACRRTVGIHSATGFRMGLTSFKAFEGAVEVGEPEPVVEPEQPAEQDEAAQETRKRGCSELSGVMTAQTVHSVPS